MHLAAPASKRPARLLLAGLVTIVLGVAVMFLLASCGSDTSTASGTMASSSSAPSVDAAIQVECVNVERAYNAWEPTAPTQAQGLTELRVRMLMDDGDAFLRAVEGYQDQASKDLAVAISAYNYDMAVINANFAASGLAEGKVVDGMLAKVGQVRGAFASFKFETCHGVI